MTNRVAGKVALITGAGRGQGRSHALGLAREGADIIAIDRCGDYASLPYAMSSADDLDETARQVEALGRRIVKIRADVRDLEAMKKGIDDAVAHLGGLDIVVANAGIVHIQQADLITEAEWDDVIGTNLKGAWITSKVTIPHLKQRKKGSLILISSSAGLKGYPGLAHYCASKFGIVGLMRSMALELGPHSIRVNSINTTNANTPMIHNQAAYRMFVTDKENPTYEEFREASAKAMSVLPIPWIEPEDATNAVLFLASDDSRYITGVALPVDAGVTIK